MEKNDVKNTNNEEGKLSRFGYQPTKQERGYQPAQNGNKDIVKPSSGTNIIKKNK